MEWDTPIDEALQEIGNHMAILVQWQLKVLATLRDILLIHVANFYYFGWNRITRNSSN